MTLISRFSEMSALSFYRSWYKETSSALLRDIVLVFDKSRSIQHHLLRDGKMVDVLHTVINTLGPKDKVKSDLSQLCVANMQKEFVI